MHKGDGKSVHYRHANQGYLYIKKTKGKNKYFVSLQINQITQKCFAHHTTRKTNYNNMSVTLALTQAIRHNDMATVEALLHHPDLNINGKEYFHEIPLFSAVTTNNVAMLATILKVPGLNVNAHAHYGTALSLACLRGYSACVEQLLTMPNISINMLDCFGNSPLSDALTHGHMSCATLLLQRPEININYRNKQYQTALWRATNQGRIPAIQALLARPELDHVHDVAVLEPNGKVYSALTLARHYHDVRCMALLTPTPFWRLRSHVMALYPLRLMAQVALGYQLVWSVSSPLWPSLPMELVTLVLTHLATDLTWPSLLV